MPRALIFGTGMYVVLRDQLEGSFDAGLVANHTWPVTVLNTNRAPSVSFVTPQNNSQQDHSKVKFIAEASDADGGVLTFEWSEAGTPLANPTTGNANGTTPATSTVELTSMVSPTYTGVPKRMLMYSRFARAFSETSSTVCENTTFITSPGGQTMSWLSHLPGAAQDMNIPGVEF